MTWIILGTGHERQHLRIFIYFFLNSDISFIICSIFANFLENIVYCLTEGSVSQNCGLGPGYFFMLCRNFEKIIFHYYL